MSISIKAKVSGLLKNIRAYRHIKHVQKKPHNGVIRVAFIAQMAEIWDKEEPVYEAMVNDDLFAVDMIVIPPYDQVKEAVDHSYDNNYFLDRYPEAIRGYQNESWINIKEKQYDYIFLQRPYDHYLPKGFRGSDLVAFSKVCFIPYGFNSADVFNGGNTNKEFFRNVYMSFMESAYMANLLKEQFKFKFEKNTHKVFNLGYPALSPYLSFPDIDKITRVLWTPRWSFDAIIGGSNFFKFKETFIELATSNPQCTFVFRPHPLMFGELMRQGIMTQAEIDEYLVHLNTIGILYDHDTTIYETFLKTDLLITDFSTIIIQFFLTKRPIIYCPSCIKLNDVLEKIQEGMYLADDAQTFLQTANDILHQNDYLQEKRLSIISNKEFEGHREAVNNIITAIKQDY